MLPGLAWTPPVRVFETALGSLAESSPPGACDPQAQRSQDRHEITLVIAIAIGVAPHYAHTRRPPQTDLVAAPNLLQRTSSRFRSARIAAFLEPALVLLSCLPLLHSGADPNSPVTIQAQGINGEVLSLSASPAISSVCRKAILRVRYVISRDPYFAGIGSEAGGTGSFRRSSSALITLANPANG